MIYKNEDIDERKNMLYKKMINEVSQKRDEKALKKRVHLNSMNKEAPSVYFKTKLKINSIQRAQKN